MIRAIADLVLVAVVAGCSGAPSPPPEDPDPAPAGAMLASAGLSVAGVVGSWSLDGMVADAPWLPADALGTVSVPIGAPLSVAFDDGAGIGSWTAQLAETSDRDGAGARTVGEGDGDGDGDAAIGLTAPPAGDWVLAVTLTRADGRGRATYSWAVSVR